MSIYKAEPTTNNKKCIYYFHVHHIHIISSFPSDIASYSKLLIYEVTHEMHAVSVYDFFTFFFTKNAKPLNIRKHSYFIS